MGCNEHVADAGPASLRLQRGAFDSALKQGGVTTPVEIALWTPP